jgi:hypothetical protein
VHGGGCLLLEKQLMLQKLASQKETLVLSVQAKTGVHVASREVRHFRAHLPPELLRMLQRCKIQLQMLHHLRS